MKKSSVKATIMIVLMLIGTSIVLFMPVSSFPNYGNPLPEPFDDDCGVCHINDGGGGALTGYGEDFAAVGGHGTDAAGAISEIGPLDSDGDGHTNDEELTAIPPTDPSDDTSYPVIVDPEDPVALIKEPEDWAVFENFTEITFDGSLSKDSEGNVPGSLSEYNWDFSDGVSLSGPIVSRNFEEEGNFTVNLTVLDGPRSDSVTITLTIFNNTGGDPPKPKPKPIINIKPVAEMVTPPETLQIDGNVTFDASGSYDPNDDVNKNNRIDGAEVDNLTYSWLFSDGASSNAKVVKKVLSEPGNFTGTLTVRDAGYLNNTTVLEARISFKLWVQAPDIVIENVFLYETKALQGENITAFGLIGNLGDVDEDVVEVQVLVDGTLLEEYSLSIPAGENRVVAAPWKAKAGTHEFKVVAQHSRGTEVRIVNVDIEIEVHPDTVPGFEGGVLLLLFVMVTLIFEGRIRMQKRRVM